MTRLIKLTWVLLLVSLIWAKPVTTSQVGYMVWDSVCIKSVSKNLKTRMEAPLVDGVPDLNKARIYGEDVDFDRGCGRIEIRREQR